MYQKLSTDEWTLRIRETADLLSLVEDVNLVANDVEKFMSNLARLELLKNIQVAHDWYVIVVAHNQSFITQVY